MTDKDSNYMTASEMLRWSANYTMYYRWGNPWNKLAIAILGLDPEKARAQEVHITDAFSRLADKIDAELAQARELSLRRGAELWAKANGWPDFKDGENFGEWLERCAIPRPRFDDEEPVQSSDMEEIGAMATYRVYMDGSWEFEPDKYEDETSPKPWDAQFGTRNDRVKRPAPEALGADGKPIVAGETVWGILSGIEGIVNSLNDDSTAYVEWDDGRWSPCIDCCNLTHTPPDTQQKIDEDAEKFHCVYFGGYSACGTCPASTGELSKKSCKQQQIFDLLRRQRELDARTGGAE